uniref:Uncharacterized protein n=1 Tax=Oryza rufipogon TaxID=4529 RepID=A0A0E0N4B7_ORYRU
MRAERDATATGTGRVDDRGEWDGLVPREEYFSQIRDQLIRPKLADKLVPPGTSERRDDRCSRTTLLAHLPYLPSGDGGGLIDGGGNRLGSSGGDRLG